MKKETIEYLHQTYPDLFSQKPSISARDGWFKIIDGVCDIVTNHLQYLPEEVRNQVYVSQIKEKFGGLRFYLNHEDEFMNGVITMAEYLSDTTCEVCGSEGSKRNIGGWIQTLCDKDFKKGTKDLEKRNKAFEKKAKAKKR